MINGTTLFSLGGEDCEERRGFRVRRGLRGKARIARIARKGEDHEERRGLRGRLRVKQKARIGKEGEDWKGSDQGYVL